MRNFKKIIPAFLFLLLTLFQSTAQSQTYYSAADLKVFNDYLSLIERKKELPTNEVIVLSGKFFLGTPYVAHTLEKEPEQLTVNLTELDCMTFVETVLALVRTVKQGEPTFEKFCQNLQTARYREKKITDYTDRLHYTSDWIYTNEQRGIVKDKTKAIGGKPWKLELSFMSTHPDSYKQLKNNPGFIDKIARIEKEISAREHYYIPKEEIWKYEKNIRNGDVVGFVTSVKGLDIAHVGFIAWDENGKMTFMHASSIQHEVIINPEPLQDYINKVKSNTGIVIFRLCE